MLVVCGVLLLHAALVFRMIPPRFLTSGELPAMGDVTRYFASAHSAMTAGGMGGYDPYVMAGYPAGAWNSMGKKGYEMAHLLLPAIPLPLLMSWYLIGSALLAPLLLWWACIRIGGGRAGLILPLAVSVAYWHLETQTNTFLQCGNVGFPFTAVLIPVAVVFYSRLLYGRHPLWWGAGLGLVAAAIFYGHPVLMVPLILGCLALSALGWRRFSELPVWGGVVVAAALSIVLALPWLRVLTATAGSYQPLMYEGFRGSLKHLVMDLFSDRAYGRHFDRNFLLQLAVVGGCAGTWLTIHRKEGLSRTLLACGGAAAGCLVIAYTFSLVPSLRSWQPYRFLVPAIVLLLPALCCAIQEAMAILSPAARPVRWVVVAVALMALPRFTGYLVDLTTTAGGREISGDRACVLKQLAAMDVKGRIVCDDVQLGHLIPYFSKKAVLGGLSFEAFVKEGFAGMDDSGRLFGRRADEWTSGKLDQYLDAYAVGYMVLSRPEWVALAGQRPGRFVREAAIGPYHLFRVTPWSGYAMDGAADVRVDSRGLSVSGLKGRECVLKFHYSPALRVPSGATLTPDPMLDDPVGFVRLGVPAGWTECRIAFVRPMQERR